MVTEDAMTAEQQDAFERSIENTYTALGKATEFWIVVCRGAFAFRFGPYTGPECGPILEQAVKERIAVTIIGQCGKAFDWELARDMGVRLADPAAPDEVSGS